MSKQNEERSKASYDMKVLQVLHQLPVNRVYRPRYFLAPVSRSKYSDAQSRIFFLFNFSNCSIFFTASSNDFSSNSLITIPVPVLSIIFPVSPIALHTTGMPMPISSACFVGEEAVLEKVFRMKKILKLLKAINIGSRFRSE